MARVGADARAPPIATARPEAQSPTHTATCTATATHPFRIQKGPSEHEAVGRLRLAGHDLRSFIAL